MTHSSHMAAAFLNRRVALASAGAAAVGLTGLRPARAHDDDDLAAHPLAGT